jgi:polar amino acid transport system permease protein
MTDWSGYIGLILQGALVTLQLTVMGSALAVVMAFIAGLGRVSRFMAVRALATTYIEFFRGTSIFVQLFWGSMSEPTARRWCAARSRRLAGSSARPASR